MQDPIQLPLSRLELPALLKLRKSYTARGLTALQAEGTATMASPGAKHQHDSKVV